MAVGTGLPIPKSNGVLAQAGVVDVEKGAGSAWARIAQGGAKLASEGFSYAEQEMHTARAAKLASSENDIERKYIDTSAKHERSPEGFLNEWGAVKEGIVSEAEPWAIPHLQKVLGKYENRGYSSALTSKRSHDQASENSTLKTNTDSAENEFGGLAAAGMLHTPQALDALDRLRGTLEVRRQAGFITDADVNATMLRVMDKADIETTKRVAKANYAANGYDREAAIEELRRGTIENTSLTLSPEEKLQKFNEGQRELHLLDSVRKADIAAVVEASKEIRERIKTVGVDQREVDDMAAALTKVGANNERLRLVKEHQERQALGVAMDGRSLPEQERLVRAGRVVASIPTAVRSYFNEASASTGVPLAYLGKVAQRESGFNPSAQAKTSSAGGMFQFIDDTWESVVGRFGGKYGFGPNTPKEDPRAATLMAAEMAKADKGALEVALGRPLSWGEVYVAHFAGRGGAEKLLKADPNARAADILPAAARANQGIFYAKTDYGIVPRKVSEVVANLRNTVRGDEIDVNPADVATFSGGLRAAQAAVVRDAQKVWAESIKPGMEGKGISPDLPTLAAISSLAAISNDEKWKREVETAIGSVDMAKKVAGLPAGQAQALMDQIKSNLEGGAVPNEVSSFNFIQKHNENARKQIAEDRIGYTAVSSNGNLPVPPPLDLTSTASFQAGLAQRVAIDRAAQDRWQLPPGSALRPSDSDQIQAALRTGDARTADTVLSALSSIPPEMLDATMATKELRSAVIGLSQSGDPAKMQAAYQFLDRERARDPLAFTHTYGKDAERHLETWQRKLQFMEPKALVDYIRRSDEPSARAARTAALEKADTDSKDLTAEKVAGYFDAIPWVPGTDPGAPLSVRATEAPGQLLDEYKQEYRDLYAEIGDAGQAKDAAVTMLKKSWGVTKVGRTETFGRVMKHPPEMVYQPVDNSHDWIGKQLDAAVRGFSGVQPTVPAPVDPMGNVTGAAEGTGLDGRAGRIYSAPRALVSDRVTEAEIGAKKPASYQVIAQAPDGRYHRLEDKDGTPLRFRPDRDAAVAESRERFITSRVKDRAGREELFRNIDAVLGRRETSPPPQQVLDATVP